MLRLFVGQRDPPTLKDGRDDVNRGVTSRDQIDEYAIIDVERGGHCKPDLRDELRERRDAREVRDARGGSKRRKNRTCGRRYFPVPVNSKR